MPRLGSTRPKLMTSVAILMLLLPVIITVQFVAPTEAVLLGASFEKYAGNPLATIPLYNGTGVVHPDVLYFSGGRDGYEYWMVYTPFEPERAPSIVRSNDGISWTDTGITNPVASEGVLDSDPDMISVSALNTWLMVSTTYGSGESKIWLAYSTDGKNWTKYDGIQVNGNTNPYILSGTDDGQQPWEYDGSYSKVTEPALFYEDGTFYLFYCTWTPDENRGKVGLATFTWDNVNNDIQNFQRNASNPLIDLAADSTFKSGCGHLDVSKLGSTYYMYAARELLGSTNYELALLTSADKISWTNQGRVLERGSTGAWDDYHIYRSSPAVDPTGQIVLFDGAIRLYYSAWPSSVAYGSDPKIGLATGTLQYAPQYRNVGPANGTTIGVGENLTLYAQGYDDTGLDWAWLWTNETGGSGRNYSEIWDFQPSASNPIIDGDALFSAGWRTEDSKVVKLNDMYYMAMASGTAGPTMDIYMLNSSSLTGPWVLMNNGNPILSRNATGWDAEWLRVQGPIVYYDGTYYLYYMGGDGSTFRIGVATANDTSFPLAWTKYGDNPILEPTGSGWESSDILSLSIQRIGPPGNEWYGHYGALGGGYYATGICYSSSPYGPFTRHPNNPIIQRDAGTWENLGPIVKDMIKVGDTIYGAYEAKVPPKWQVGLYSGRITDGILNATFSKHPDNPIIAGDEGSGTETANPGWYYEDQVLYLFINSYTANWRYFDLFSSEAGTYGSPLNMNSVADTWTWSNFTWCNTSITDGTAIAWRIYYSDTSGNENATDTHYFTVKTEAPEYDYVDLDTSNVDASEDKGTHSDFDAEKAAAGCDTITEQSASAFGIMSYRKNITINHAYIDTDQNNFPVLIDIYDADLHNDVQSDGDDIDFTDSSGSHIDHEIEYFSKNYNGTHAHLIAWVRANLTGASDTTICMIYGNPVCGSQQNPTSVWDSNYQGVWHLDATSSPDQDSSANNQGAAWFNTPTQTDAQIGKGKDFDDGDGTKTAEDSDHTAASMTVEGWINGDTFSNTETWNEATFVQRYYTYYFMISKDATNRGKPKVYLYTSGASDWKLADTALDVGKWHYVAFTYTSGSLRIYVNGTLDREYTDVTGDVQAGGGSGSQYVYFGAQDSGSPFRTLDGKLDEMRLSSGVRSPEWLNTTYQNVANLGAFLSVGSEESSPSTNYELDLEIEWTNVNYTRPSETLCIKAGAFSGSEALQVRIWNSTDSSWDPIMYLAANQWNNVSVTSHLTESTFTVQFLGGTESGDTTQDSWTICSSLLRTHTLPPTYLLTVSSAVGGTTNPAAGTYTYDENEIATVIATANTYYSFSYWVYDGHTSTSNPISLTMSEDYTLTPVFVYSPPPSVPEFPLGLTLEILFIPVMVYLLWRSKHRKKMLP